MHRHKWLAKHLTHNHSNFAQKLNMRLQTHLKKMKSSEEEKFEFFLSRNCVKSSVGRGRVNSIEVNKNIIENKPVYVQSW